MQVDSNLEMDCLRGRIGSSAAIFVNRLHSMHAVEIFGQPRPTNSESDGQIKFPQETQDLIHTEVLGVRTPLHYNAARRSIGCN